MCEPFCGKTTVRLVTSQYPFAQKTKELLEQHALPSFNSIMFHQVQTVAGVIFTTITNLVGSCLAMLQTGRDAIIGALQNMIQRAQDTAAGVFANALAMTQRAKHIIIGAFQCYRNVANSVGEFLLTMIQKALPVDMMICAFKGIANFVGNCFLKMTQQAQDTAIGTSTIFTKFFVWCYRTTIKLAQDTAIGAFTIVTTFFGWCYRTTIQLAQDTAIAAFTIFTKFFVWCYRTTTQLAQDTAIAAFNEVNRPCGYVAFIVIIYHYCKIDVLVLAMGSIIILLCIIFKYQYLKYFFWNRDGQSPAVNTPRHVGFLMEDVHSPQSQGSRSSSYNASLATLPPSMAEHQNTTNHKPEVTLTLTIPVSASSTMLQLLSATTLTVTIPDNIGAAAEADNGYDPLGNVSLTNSPAATSSTSLSAQQSIIINNAIPRCSFSFCPVPIEETDCVIVPQGNLTPTNSSLTMSPPALVEQSNIPTTGPTAGPYNVQPPHVTIEQNAALHTNQIMDRLNAPIAERGI
jgi:hypothetical protein